MISTKVAVVVVGVVMSLCGGEAGGGAGGTLTKAKTDQPPLSPMKHKLATHKLFSLKHLPFKNTLKGEVKGLSSSSSSSSSSSVSVSVSSSSSSSSSFSSSSPSPIPDLSLVTTSSFNVSPSSSSSSSSSSSFSSSSPVPPSTPSSSPQPTGPLYIDSGLFRHQFLQARARTTPSGTTTKLEAPNKPSQTGPTTFLLPPTTPQKPATSPVPPIAAKLMAPVDSYDYDGHFDLWDDLSPFGGELGLYGGDLRGERFIGGFRPPGH